MKETRFRIRNTKTNKWIHKPGDEVNLFGESVLLGMFMHGVGIMELNDCIALQYTGLKDRNGKEIYEGDIVKQEFDYNDDPQRSADMQWSTELSKIVWHEEEYRFGYQNLKTRFGTSPTLHLPRRWESSHIEVVGNIYDNPELLK